MTMTISETKSIVSQVLGDYAVEDIPLECATEIYEYSNVEGLRSDEDPIAYIRLAIDDMVMCGMESLIVGAFKDGMEGIRGYISERGLSFDMED